MNALFKLRKGSPIVGIIPLKHVLYFALLSDIIPMDDGETKWGVCTKKYEEVFDYFEDFDKRELEGAFEDLVDAGLICIDDEESGDGTIYLGEYRGRRFFPFEQEEAPMQSVQDIEEALREFNATPRRVSRSKYIKDQIDGWLSKGIESMTPGDFTELHGYLYEIYTGGETYILRNKAEHFQTTNMLKAYNKQNVFAIIVEGTLHYDKYRRHGVPTITNVACMKDDVFRSLTKGGGSKDYMRDADDNSEF